MGIEALSRGAKTALFVETTREACEAISDNLERTRTAAQATVRRADVGRVVARPAPHPFELVLIDPPYERGLGFVDRILENLLLGGWIAERGTVVVEAELGSVGWPEGLHETRTRIFGRTQVSVAMRHE